MSSLNVLILFCVLMSIVLRSQSGDLNSAKIVFYFGPGCDDYQSYGLEQLESLLQHPKFIHNQTNCYIHGYNGTQEAYSVRLIVDAYLRRNSINLLTVDWAILAGGSYVSAQENILELAPRIAESILKLFKAGLDSHSFSLVGHSLGALAVGLIGREVFKQSNGNILLHRVTALDPSNPAAHSVFILPPVEKTDAEFVDVIHTDSGGIATNKSMGHADFWPNGGAAIQPGCPAASINDKCSHRKAWAYWAESVADRSEPIFLSFKASSFKDFIANKGRYLRQDGVLMGIDCPTSPRGNYYLQLVSDYGAVEDVGLLG